MKGEFLGLLGRQWLDLVLSVLFVVLVLTLGRRLIKFLLDRGVQRIVGRTRSTFDDVVLDALRQPLFGWIVVWALDKAVRRLDFIPISWLDWLNDTFYLLYLLLGFFAAVRLVENMMRWYGKVVAAKNDTNLDEQLMPFAQRVVRIMIWLIAIITLLGHFDVDVSAMVTTLGVGSLAIALAGQAVLADTISGFVIMIDRPFRIGDRIEIQDLGTWGDVVDVGLRSSRIRTLDNRMVIVPNSVIGKALIVNHSYPDSQYRLQLQIGVAYGTDIELARQTMIAAVKQVEGVLTEHPVEALFLEFGASALNFRVRWWLESYEDTRKMFDRVNTAIYQALKEAEIEIPFPQMAVHLIQGDHGA